MDGLIRRKKTSGHTNSKSHSKSKEVSMPVKTTGKLGKQIVVIDCPDKKFDEKWFKGRNIGNLPKPYRAVLFGVPNCGKSTYVKNLLLNADPPFDTLTIVGCSDDTTDFKDLEPSIVLDTLPSLDSFDRSKKNALVIDDWKAKNPADKARLDRLFGFVSSHCNTTIIMCLQDIFALHSPTIRRMCNVFVLWKNADKRQNLLVEPRVGLEKGTIDNLMRDLDFGKRDSLMIDLTPHTPAPLRKNLFEKIKTDFVPDLPTG